MTKRLFYIVLGLILWIVSYRYYLMQQYTYNPPRHAMYNMVGKTPQSRCMKRCLKDGLEKKALLACQDQCRQMTYDIAYGICVELQERCSRKYRQVARCKSEYKECLSGANVLRDRTQLPFFALAEG